MKTPIFCIALLAPVMASTLSNFPLSFEERAPVKGQYVSRGPGYAIRLHATGADLRAGKAQISVVLQSANGKASAQPEFVELGRNRIGFNTGAYDRARPLVIDPVLQYTAYLGGSSADEANAIAADAAGNSYVTGFTRSIDFPSKPGTFQPAPQGS